MDGTEDYYSEVSREYANRTSFQQMPEESEKQLKELLDRFLDNLLGEKVLDAGCGPGRDTEYFKEQGYQSVGIDSAQGMIEIAEETGEADYHVMDLRDLSFKEGKFSGIWCNTVMQFLDDEGKKQALSEFSRIMDEGGILYVTFKLGEGTHTREEDGLERRLITKREALNMLEETGIKPEDHWTFQLNDMTVLGALCVKE